MKIKKLNGVLSQKFMFKVQEKTKCLYVDENQKRRERLTRFHGQEFTDEVLETETVRYKSEVFLLDKDRDMLFTGMA